MFLRTPLILVALASGMLLTGPARAEEAYVQKRGGAVGRPGQRRWRWLSEAGRGEPEKKERGNDEEAAGDHVRAPDKNGGGSRSGFPA